MDVIYQNVFNRTLDDERESLAALQRQLRLRYEDELAAEASDNSECRQRAMERVKASRLNEEFHRVCGELEAEEARQDKLLNALAPKIEMKPDLAMHLIQVISNLSFPQDNRAEDILKPLQDLLDGHGFATYFRRTRHHFELWSDCPPYMADAADRRLNPSIDYEKT